MRNFSELKKEDSYKPKIVGNLTRKNYIKCENNKDRNKKLSIKEHLNKIRAHLRDIINPLKKFDAWKFQLATAINFISSKSPD